MEKVRLCNKALFCFHGHPLAQTLAADAMMRCDTGQTVEMHGSIRELVCPECGTVTEVTPAALRAMRARSGIPCPAGCAGCHLRMRVMLYDDGEGACPPCCRAKFRLRLFPVQWHAQVLAVSI